MAGSSLFDKVWNSHVVADLGGGTALLHVDRQMLHDLSGGKVLADIRARGYRVRNPELTVATPDHGVSSEPGRTEETYAGGTRLLRLLRDEAKLARVKAYDINQDGQGIVHVIGPELGLTQPGSVIVCGDSHTCTHGGLGALAFGVGRSEVTHVLATQTLPQKKPRRMRVRFEGALGAGVAPKDLILHLIGQIGAGGGNGHAIEYAGSVVRAMSVEGRLTMCNLSIELGAKIGMIAADDIAFEYLAGREFSPKGAMWDQALAYWRGLATDDDAEFDTEYSINASAVGPQITWGTSPQQVVSVDGSVPVPKDAAEEKALHYMGLTPGLRMEGIGIDWVFIGSCTNGRIEDLRAAAHVARGRKVAGGVRAWVVPGSQKVKRAAEAEGLDSVFREAGFEWREPGCSMCLAANGEVMPPLARSVSTTNRNFVGRQGPEARTHLASPAMAAAAAITGHITDIRKLAV